MALGFDLFIIFYRNLRYFFGKTDQTIKVF